MVTNFFRLELTPPADRFPVQRVPYSEEKLRELRAEHNSRASFARYENFIYVSPQPGDAPIQIGQRVRVRVEQHPDLFSSLIRHLLFRTFRNETEDLKPESFAPLRFASRLEADDPLAELLPKELRGKLGFPRVNEVHVREVTAEGTTRFGLVIQCRHHWRFPVSLAQLRQEGFGLIGRTVIGSVPLPGLEDVLAPDETLLGVLEEIAGDDAIIQTNAGPATWPLARLTLQRSHSQVGEYLDFKVGPKKTERLFARLREFNLERAHPGRAYGEIRRLANWFAKQTYANADGFGFRVTLDTELPDTGLQLEPTRLVFSPTPGASEHKPFTGLLNHGPYDADRFDRKDLRLLVIFHERNRGAATEYVGSLIKGIPETYFQRGLRELFRLHKVDHVLREITATFPEDYERAIDLALKEAGPHEINLAIVECPDESHSFPPAENPYYRAKARLMSFGIPMQGVTEAKLRASKRELGFTLGPTALQIYAKLGGCLWLLPSSQSVDHELIIGVGHALRRENAYADAEQSRVVGLTTLFLGDGRFLFGQELPTVPYAEYFDTLLGSLAASLDDVSAEYGWKKGATVRLVFHVFKPIKNVEADVVAALVERYADYRIIFAFVTVATEHPWMIYADAGQTATGTWEMTPCERGANVVLDETSCLLQLRGPKDRPGKQHRLPAPVLVRIHESSTYRDLGYIAQQIHDFSYMSWRSFFPGETPVTVFYSNLMAKLSAALARVPGWNPVVLPTHFRRRKWFL